MHCGRRHQTRGVDPPGCGSGGADVASLQTSRQKGLLLLLLQQGSLLKLLHHPERLRLEDGIAHQRLLEEIVLSQHLLLLLLEARAPEQLLLLSQRQLRKVIAQVAPLDEMTGKNLTFAICQEHGVHGIERKGCGGLISSGPR